MFGDFFFRDFRSWVGARRAWDKGPGGPRGPGPGPGVGGVGTIPIPDSVSDASWGMGGGENTNPDPASDISSHSALLKNTTAA